MKSETRSTDAKARVSLPKSFANATVIVEQISPTEVRIRKAVVVPADEFKFLEESRTPLSDHDRDLFLALLDDPGEPSPTLRKALDKHKRRK